jgi:hypothetical protein
VDQEVIGSLGNQLLYFRLPLGGVASIMKHLADIAFIFSQQLEKVFIEQSGKVLKFRTAFIHRSSSF